MCEFNGINLFNLNIIMVVIMQRLNLILFIPSLNHRFLNRTHQGMAS
ncbi:hypothetical protein XSR1_570011 [Xenorhabdus szentirmaii DSM 16338]|uniref:Uncharacterized protein n=1 Tax=Xenorhabdus szentirmaii DSM 16338 TaxID=1427518 RepID=W1J4E6_9GAMM|nr:hypothetical protein XSR1_570011 [Xenorhabdus szentirmaii DSM 16338]